MPCGCLDDEMCAFIMFILLDICWYVPGIPNKLSSAARSSVRSTVQIPSFVVQRRETFKDEKKEIWICVSSLFFLLFGWIVPIGAAGMGEASPRNIFNIRYGIMHIFFFLLFCLLFWKRTNAEGEREGESETDEIAHMHVWYRCRSLALAW